MTPVPRRALARLGAVAAVAVLALPVLAGPASAHDQLVGSSPTTDEDLDAAPDAVRLDYSADVLTFGAAIIVADADGGTWQAGEPSMSGSSVTQPLEPGMPDGAYEIRWRVVSSDGHPITGLVLFTVGGPDADPVRPVPAASSTEAAAAPADASAGVPAPGPSPWRSVGVAVGGAVLALGLYGLVLRGRRRAVADGVPSGADVDRPGADGSGPDAPQATGRTGTTPDDPGTTAR